MHRPPLTIPGPEHPNAFDNIPVRDRPDHCDARCGRCHGRGAWITELHDHGRCKITACDVCQGSGWIASNGMCRIHDIVMIGRTPTWVIRMERRPVPDGARCDMETLEG